MSNLNTAIRYLPGASRNPDVEDLTEEFGRRDNASFLAEVARRLRERVAAKRGGLAFDPDGIACIGLIGEYGLQGYALRRAQELIRLDRMASYWSHAFLVLGKLSTEDRVNRSRRESAWIAESALRPAEALRFFTERNGVSPRRIAEYAPATFRLSAAHCVPNIAILAIGLTPEEREAVLARASEPDVDQLVYDLTGLLGSWYAHVANPAGNPNPLGSGVGIPGAVYCQLAYDAAGIDLAPGAHQRNTAPEHIWQAATYLHEAIREMGREHTDTPARPVAGWCCVRDRTGVVAPAGAELPRTIADLMESAG